MNKAIEILNQYIQSYGEIIRIYNSNQNHGMITEYVADEANKIFGELKEAVKILQNHVKEIN